MSIARIPMLYMCYCFSIFMGVLGPTEHLLIGKIETSATSDCSNYLEGSVSHDKFKERYILRINQFNYMFYRQKCALTPLLT